MKILRLIARAWYRWWFRKLTVVKMSDLPNHPAPGVVHLVHDADFAWAAVLRCPCGCDDVITLNLIGQRPRWSTNIEADGRLTIRPSIWRSRGCKSHFWIRKGKIHWVISPQNSTSNRKIPY